MFKKSISIMLALVMLVSSAMGISLVNVSAITESNSRIELQELITEYNLNFAFDYPSHYYYIYTKASFNAFLDAKQKAENLLTDENTTDEEFENMIAELQTARNNLVEIIRSESYERLLMLSAGYSWDFDYTPEYWYSFYTRESYDAYLAAKQKAEKLLAEEYPSDEELEAMIEEFKAAHDNLVRVYKSESYIDLAYMYSVYSYDFEQPPEYWYNIYTQKSYDTYLAAKQKAEKLLADDNATDEELEAMIKEFKDARDNLVEIEDTGWADVTKDELEIQRAVCIRLYIHGMDESEASYVAFRSAYNYAKEIIEKENPTQNELNNAYYSLKNAFDNLKGNNRPYVEDLEDLMRFECSTVPGTMYSEKSLEEYDKASAFAREVIKKENPTREELYTAYYNLYFAHRKLEIVGGYATPYLLGDCDGDNDITVKDATKLQMILAKFDNIYNYYTRADVDRNFSIDIQDATKIQFYCAGFTGEEYCGFTGEYNWRYYYAEFYTI